ncbi:uncharacterized membrane protein YbhN (UPF0104 family) [Pseudomonas lurida]
MDVKKAKKIVGAVVSLFLLAGLMFYLSPADILSHAQQFPPALLVLVFALMVGNVVVVTFRFWRILSHFDHPLSWLLVFKASAAANIASLLVIPLFGQMAGRQAVLQSAGVSAVENAVIAAYERTVVAAISAAFAMLGALYLLEGVVSRYLDELPIVEIFSVLLVALVLSLVLGIGKFEIKIGSSLFVKRNAQRLLEVALISSTSNVLMLTCFTCLFSVVAPNVSMLQLFSAAAIVSFAAGLPVSFGGWGLREIVSVSVLGTFAVSAEQALAASILCGLLSVLSVISLAPFALRKGKYIMIQAVEGGEVDIPLAQRKLGGSYLERSAAWVLCFCVSLFIFFQIIIKYGESAISVNLADPFAILALSVVLLNAVFSRSAPRWRFLRVNSLLLLVTLVMFLGYAHGFYSIGANGWALGKIFGWFVLLGFASAGYLAAAYYGLPGVRRIVETMVAVICVIIILQIALRVLHLYGIIHWSGFTHSIDGYVGNRNALAFQVTCVAAAFISLSPFYQGGYLRAFPAIKCSVFAVVALAIMIAGIFYTSSRSGIVTILMLLLFAGIFNMMKRSHLLAALIVSCVFYAFIIYFPMVLDFFDHLLYSVFGYNFSFPRIQAQPEFSLSESDAGRASINSAAITAWLQSPWWGNGLGYFFNKSSQLVGFPVIIHNTTLWVLTEFGIAGLSCFALMFVYLFVSAFFKKKRSVRDNAIILLLLGFALMSLFHEVMYQRVFWFLLGLMLASQFVRAPIKLSTAALATSPAQTD